MSNISRLYFCLYFLVAACCLPASIRAQGPSEAEKLSFFEKNIRPVLVKECYSCHAKTAKRIRGGLTLDTREGIRKGGDTGPAVVPGSTRRSLILQALRHVKDDLKMPPSKKLPADVIANFEKWIASGAVDPRGGEVKSTKREIDIEKGRKYWAFQSIKKPAVPKVKATDWARTDIDRYILAAMEAKNLKPVADAKPHVLLRRVYFDLIGLPPSPRAVTDFEKDYKSNPESALREVVDKLLKSPQFGERWGRHWLDVARYAESSGKSSNIAYPHAWRYRDYVIDAFNKDKPYDQFIREQLAGDLLASRDPTRRAEGMIATGFLAIGPKNHDERNRRQFQMDLVDEQIDVTFQAFQGLTVACARCHDHKFDPIPQKDYYALAGIFQSSESCYGTIRIIQSNHPSPLITLPSDAKVPIPLTKLDIEDRLTIHAQMEQQRERMRDVSGDNAFIQRIFMQSRVAQLQSRLDLYERNGDPKALAMGVRESRFGRASDARLLNRGELDQPGERVSRGFPQVLTRTQPRIRYNSSGRRELADWIASKENPLTARVMANRVWLHLIGQGIVGTPDNFGSSGQRPTHPKLLDHLATTFVNEGWSVKKLIREIVLSRSYQLSSQFDKKNFEVDPDNHFVWRMPQRRLEAEAIRDTMLKLGGRLNLKPPVASPVARQGEGRAISRGGRFRRPGSTSDSETHRTVYLPIVRDQLPEMLTLFDFPDPSLIIGQRSATSVPAQSLFLMNNSFVIEQAEGLADDLLLDRSNDRDKLIYAYRICYSRTPSEKEIKTAMKFLEDYGKSHNRRQTWAALCQALFAGVEFCHY